MGFGYDLTNNVIANLASALIFRVVGLFRRRPSDTTAIAVGERETWSECFRRWAVNATVGPFFAGLWFLVAATLFVLGAGFFVIGVLLIGGFAVAMFGLARAIWRDLTEA